MSTDDTTPTPAPVAVPEGGWRDGDLIQIRFSNGDYEVVERRDGFFGDYADGEISRWMERAMVVSVIAPREDALRPEPVTASEHRVPGAENFNALLDDVLANPEAREAFEAAQAEPVTAEERLARVRAYIDDPGNWSGLDGRRTTLLALIDGKENDRV